MTDDTDDDVDSPWDVEEFVRPLAPELRDWRPPTVPAPDSVVCAADVLPPDDPWLDCLERPADHEDADPEETDVPAIALGWTSVETNGRAGSSAASLYAVPRTDGRFVIAAETSDGGRATVGAPVGDLLPTLGELMDLFESIHVVAFDEEEHSAYGQAAREMLDDWEPRSKWRGWVSMGSDLYPMLQAADRECEEAWIALRP